MNHFAKRLAAVLLLAALTVGAALPAGVDTEADLERVRAIYREKGATL